MTSRKDAIDDLLKVIANKGRRRIGQYPWDDWLIPGKIWYLEKDVQFLCEVHRMVLQIRNRAKQRGIKVRISVKGPVIKLEVLKTPMTTVWRLLMERAALPWVLANGRIAIGWGEIGDIQQLGTLDAIAEAIWNRNANDPNHATRGNANVEHGSHSLHDFCYAMQPGDLVIVSERSRTRRGRRRGVWEVDGEYEYADPAAAPLNYQHQRRAHLTELDADALWLQAGGRLAHNINYRTLDRCANEVE